jgi:putative membrane protein
MASLQLELPIAAPRLPDQWCMDFPGNIRSNRILCVWCAVVATVGLPTTAFAHVGTVPYPHDLWTTWSFEPAVVLGIVLMSWLYVRGVRALWHRAGKGRGVPVWRAGCYAVGIGALAIALISPVDGVSAALFSVHMVQHLLLVMLAAPLLVLGQPHIVLLWGLPRTSRRAIARAWRGAARLRSVWRLTSHPAAAWALHTAALWVWHAPRLYEAAVREEGMHALEHATFLLTALLFWWVLAGHRARRRLGFGAAVLYLFAASLQSVVLGALLALSRQPWYQVHFGTTAPWGLSPLEDQRLAGLIMWVPAGIVYIVALVPWVLDALEDRPEKQATPALAGR